MSEHISAVIYYDSEVCNTENGVVFLSENTVRLVFNQNIDLTELRKRIRGKIFGTTPMKVSSIKYRFCASVDPVTYDSFDIKGTPSTFTAGREEYTIPARQSVSGWQNTEVPVFSNSMEYPTPARHSVSGWDMHLSGSIFDAGNTYWGMTSTSSGWQSTSDWRCYETSIRMDDVLPTTSTGDGTFYVAHVMGHIMSPMQIHLERSAPMVQELHYFLNQCLFQPYLKMLNGVQMMKKKIHNSRRIRL
ncbi:hypothetical protein PVK06_005839 [Gossypium arboreum]|uniref:Uncharacterized protein n=1 Tax=Gossypium arboreum TaxID=29729 RepID=A0ABR0QX08_GOSAR|nr:hypothetical protein PVK06_005839 [Gossypium arboreum]